ncbi:IclR family transcriptional regulator [Advenella kashmirensis]
MVEITGGSDEPETHKKGIASVEAAARLLQVVEANPEPMTLKEIAEAVGYSTSKAHHYLVSLTRCGLLDRERGGMRYTLGSFALRLGLSALGRSGTANFVSNTLYELREEIGHSTAYAVWSERGPLVTHFEEAKFGIGVSMRLGTVLPLVNSPTSAVFIAWLPESELKPVLSQLPADVMPIKEIVKIRERTRRDGGAHAAGVRNPRVAGAAVPVFGPSNRLEGAIATIGFIGQFDDSASGDVFAALRRHAASLSKILGQRSG